MSPSPEKIDELVEFLTGTANTLDQGMLACQIELQWEDFVTAAIEDKIFLCDTCGWWDTIDELNNDTSEQLCPDCVPWENLER